MQDTKWNIIICTWCDGQIKIIKQLCSVVWNPIHLICNTNKQGNKVFGKGQSFFGKENIVSNNK